VSGQPPGFFDRAADAVAAGVPGAERHTFAGQGHVADPKVVAPVLERFFMRGRFRSLIQGNLRVRPRPDTH
jgi:hypothetical protein